MQVYYIFYIMNSMKQYEKANMNSMKRQNDRILKEKLPRSVVSNMLLEISGEITPERMKGWSQNKKNTQL